MPGRERQQQWQEPMYLGTNSGCYRYLSVLPVRRWDYCFSSSCSPLATSTMRTAERSQIFIDCNCYPQAIEKSQHSGDTEQNGAGLMRPKNQFTKQRAAARASTHYVIPLLSCITFSVRTWWTKNTSTVDQTTEFTTLKAAIQTEQAMNKAVSPGYEPEASVLDVGEE